MTTGRKYFSGKSLEIALMQAARHHGLQPEELAYRKIEKRHGFLKAPKGVVIEVDPESPREASSAAMVEDTPPVVEEEAAMEVQVAPDATAEPSPPAIEEAPASSQEVDASDDIEEPEEVKEPELVDEPEAREAPAKSESSSTDQDDYDYKAPEATEEFVQAARRGLQEIMGFAKLDLEVEVGKGEGQLEIELTGVDRDRLVEDRGNLLLAIQHLLPRLIRGYTGRSIPCHVDSQDFHASREIELKKMAEDAAQEVLDRQRPRTLPPMNPAERRIIHVTLADTNEVSTESQGKGFFKRVTISPAMRRPRGFDRY